MPQITVKNRKEISFEFEAVMRGNREALYEMGVKASQLDRWVTGMSKVDIDNLVLHQFAEKVGFPKERMFL